MSRGSATVQLHIRLSGTRDAWNVIARQGSSKVGLDPHPSTSGIEHEQDRIDLRDV